MTHLLFSRRRWTVVGIIALLIVLVAGLLPGVPRAALAQSGTLTYGSAVQDSITDTVPFVIYQFAGAAGDQITAYAVGVSPGMAPTLNLLGPEQQQLATTSGDPFGTESGVARIGFLLPADGPYFLMVASTGGTQGDFLLRLDVSNAVAAGQLPGDTHVALDIPTAALPTTLNFPANPSAAQTLQLTTTSPDFGFLVQIYAPDGLLIGALNGDAVSTVSLVLEPGAGSYAVTVGAVTLEMQGTVDVLLASGGTIPASGGSAGGSGGDLQPTATPQVVLSPTPSVCRVTSSVNVNVRSGPATNYPAFGSLFAGSFLEVTGRNSDASWYVVDYNGQQGWVSNAVVREEGPCGSLPYIVPPPSPTPVPPTFTPTPAATATPEPPIVSFTANGGAIANITAGDCVLVEWFTANIQAVYYEGTGVAGVGNRNECPPATTSYALRVVFRDSTEHVYTVAVNVSP